LYHRFGNHIEFILQRGTSLYLGSGLPSLGSKLQDFIIIALESDFQSISSSSKVVQAGPEALNIGLSKVIFHIVICKFFIKS
jgi:hypothetical protein